MVLVFTYKEDAHPNPVFERLTEWGVPFFRLNTEDLLSDYTFTWWADGKVCDFEILNNQNGLRLKGSEITAVWDRRPEPPKTLPIKNTEKIDEFNRREALAFLHFIRQDVEHIPSIGSIVGDRFASSKMVQYRTAVDCGFIIPDTVYANSKPPVEAFAKKHKALCLKAIEGTDVWDEEQGVDYVFYSQTLESADVATIPEEAFRQTVNFVQDYVPKQYELRVTVVDEDVFAAIILSQELPEDKGKIDWRQGYDSGLTFSTYSLPEDIRGKCIMLVHALGLNFGCIDLIVRPDGQYVFLECNPNGQWLWIELETGLKISESIARFLATQKPYSIWTPSNPG